MAEEEKQEKKEIKDSKENKETKENKEVKDSKETKKTKKSKEAAEESGEAKDAGKKKSKLKSIVFLALFIVVIGGGLGAGYYFFGNKIISSIQKIFAKKPQEAEQQGGEQQAGEQQTGGEQQEAKEKKKEAIGPILSLDPFVFNMSGNQSKYAKVTLGLELKDPKVMEETKKMIPVIRDRILSIFGTKAPEALMDVTQRNAMKGEIQASLKTLFKDAEDLQAVYITDIIIQ
jgi:flagellar basal body-associated protein FliL